MELNVTGAFVYFEIPIFGGIPISQTTVSFFLVTVLLCWACIYFGKNLKKRPDGKQVLVEKGVMMLHKMVVETMEEVVRPGFRCLDLGSGSGILSIAALRLGAGEAVGVDIDPKAETIAAENAAYNGFTAPAFTALTGNVTTDKPLMQRLSQQEWDVVLVNIVADVIIGLAPVLPAFLTDKSVLICSGILDVRLPEVIAALEKAGLTIQQIRSQEDWRCVVAKGGKS